MMKAAVGFALVCSAAFGQILIPDGTKIRLRLDQTISSATADEGQTVELSVTEAIKVDGQVVIPEGARATGNIVQAQAKRRMGRAGKLDFSVERVRAGDGEWIPVRYSINKKNGDSKAVSTGIITAGVAVVFWPAAPFVLLRHGKDVTINKGVIFDVFTDRNHEYAMNATPKMSAPAQSVPVHAPMAPVAPTQPSVLRVSAPMQPMAQQAVPEQSAGVPAAVTVTSSTPGADIEINGAFVGSTPTTLKLAPGAYTVTVRSGVQMWQRVLQATSGSDVTLNATFDNGRPTAMVRAR